MTHIIAKGLLIPFLGTALGSALVFFMKRELDARIQKILSGFAAGAMIYVVVEELVPEMAEGEHSNWGTIAFSIGFVVMMVLDVALG
jgi:ZIP family zinc transporter